MDKDWGWLIVLLIVGLVAWQSGVLQGLFQTGTTGVNQAPPAAAEVEVPVEQALPTYQLTSVSLYLKDKMNPKAGVANIEVEVLELPEGVPNTIDYLSTLASDPTRQIVDEATTDSTGKATFSAGTIFVNTPYIYSIRGDTTVYDDIVIRSIPAPSAYFKIDSYTFKEPIYVYKVGNFSTMTSLDSNNDDQLTASELSSLNLTGDTGQVYIEFDITVGESEAGKVIKDPVLVLRSPEGYELEPGDVVSLYIVRKSGSNLGIPAISLDGYIDTTPIKIIPEGATPDRYGKYYLTVADSATYTVKLTVDADQINPSDDKLQICLDDLGGYRATDWTTKSTKASPECITLVFAK